MAQQLKILHIFRDISPQGGAARAMIALAKYSKHQHKIINLMPLIQGCINHLLAHEADLPILGKNHLPSEIEQADIVQLHWWQKPEIQEFIETQWSPMRLLVWTHVVGNIEPHLITSQLVAFSDLLVATGPQTFDEIPMLKQIPNRTDWVYGPADFERLSDFTPKEHEGFNVGYVGSLSFDKMYSNYVAMSKNITMSDVKFIVCGGGSGSGTLQEQAKDDNRFQFPGYIKDIKPWLETFDVFGYPVTRGSAELVLQEAMYCGVPPVVFPVGGISRLVIDNYTGLLVRTEHEYVEAIKYLYYHPDERKRLGQNAHQYAVQVLGGENSARKMDKIYKQLMTLPKKQRSYHHYSSMNQNVELPRKISIVFSGRDDNYGGNFKKRLWAAWTRNKKEFEERGIEVEWIFIEWNPVNEDYLSYQMAPFGFRCYVISPEVHDRICTHPQMEFMQFFAKNAGIRRSRNHWVLITNPDCIFDCFCLDFIAKKPLLPYMIYRAERRDIEIQDYQTDFPHMFMHTIRTHDSCRGYFPTQAAGDFILLYKHAVNFGYDEDITFSDVGTDGRFLLNWTNLDPDIEKNFIEEIGTVFKIAHPELFAIDEDAVAKKDTHKGQTIWDYKGDLPYENQPDWGLLDSKMELLAENVWYVTDQHNWQECVHWIDTISKAIGREHYHDQTPQSLVSLMNMAYEYQPTKIVELGTLFGTSLRAWIHAGGDAKITAVDQSFKPLLELRGVLPIDLSNVTLLEQNIFATNFSKLWNKEDTVILYIDAHGSSLMEFVLEQAIPILPKGSIVAVDDLWYHPERIDSKNAPGLYQKLVVPQVDPESSSNPKWYSPYWEGGSFFGYEEVAPLMAWLKKYRVSLVFNPGVKNVWWEVD